MTSNNTDLLPSSSGGQKTNTGLLGLKSRCWQGLFFLEAAGENPSPCLFQLIEIVPIS